MNTAPARVVAVSFPRALLPLRHRDLGTLTGTRVPGTGGPGALISSLARQLPGQLDGMGSAAHRLGGAVLDLLTAVFAARLDRAATPPGTPGTAPCSCASTPTSTRGSATPG